MGIVKTARRSAELQEKVASHARAESPVSGAPVQHCSTERTVHPRAVFSPKIFAARGIVAEIFDFVMRELEEEGFDQFSNVAVARFVGCHEKQIRQYRSGEKALQWGFDLIFPIAIVRRMRREIDRRRAPGGGL